MSRPNWGAPTRLRRNTLPLAHSHGNSHRRRHPFRFPADGRAGKVGDAEVDGHSDLREGADGGMWAAFPCLVPVGHLLVFLGLFPPGTTTGESGPHSTGGGAPIMWHSRLPVGSLLQNG